MLNMRVIRVVLMLLCIVCMSCRSQNTLTLSDKTDTIPVLDEAQDSIVIMPRVPLRGAHPHVIVYRTVANFDTLVPVTMNISKTLIKSYPAPSDLNSMQMPVPVGNGFLLDRRGISINSAFLNIGYRQYMELKELSATKLMQYVTYKKPFVEIWDCGAISSRSLPDSVKVIVANGFEGCDCIFKR